MNCEALYNQIAEKRNEETAKKMSAYLRNQFLFMGVQTPERKAIFKAFFKPFKRQTTVGWEFIDSSS